MNDNPNNRNGYPPKQINRIATPIRLDEHGTPLPSDEKKEKKRVPNKRTKKRQDHDPSTMIFITVLLIILAILCAFAFFYVIPRYMEQRQMSERTTTTTTTRRTNASSVITSLSINNGSVLNALGFYEVDDAFSLELNEATDGFNIAVNGVVVTQADEVMANVGRVDDIILFQVQNTDERFSRLLGVTTEGKIIYTLDYISDAMALLRDSSSVVYNRISFVALSSKIDGTKLFTKRDEQPVDICDTAALSELGIDDNFVVMGNYSIEYLGNQEFATPVSISNVTLGEYKTVNNLCN